MSSKRGYQIPVIDKPDSKTLQQAWHIQKQTPERVVLEPLTLDASPYKKAAVEGYMSRLSLSYEKRRPDVLDSLSTSWNNTLGRSRSTRLSTSFSDLHVPHKASLGWRPWSRVETKIVAEFTSADSFDRTYSRQYTRPYSRPYNVDPIVPVASYSTSYVPLSASRYNTTGTAQEIPYRPNRDYKSHLGASYRVRSYQKRVVTAGRSRDLLGA